MADKVKYLSVCSGIEAASLAWKPLGWQAVAFSEIEPFPCALLAHHYPEVPNLGDMTQYEAWKIPSGTVDVLVGGTPCQSFSVAGHRGGLDDPRGQLMLAFLGIAHRLQPRWIVWENVPGVLSSNRGRDFGTFLGALGNLGYGWAYRVLDARWFGVPQRRRRVFVVGHSGDWTCPGKVLFESESVCRDLEKSIRKRQRVGPSLESRSRSGGSGTEFLLNGGMIEVETYVPTESLCLNAGGAMRIDAESETFVAHQLTSNGADASEDGTGRGSPLVVASTLNGSGAGGSRPCGQANEVGFCVPVSFQPRVGRNGRGAPSEIVGALNAQSGATGTGDAAPAVTTNLGVRRLTPTEWERLMGMPDGYTAIPYRGKPAKDAPRYRAIGNSMAVPVMRWIGERISNAE